MDGLGHGLEAHATGDAYALCLTRSLPKDPRQILMLFIGEAGRIVMEGGLGRLRVHVLPLF